MRAVGLAGHTPAGGAVAIEGVRGRRGLGREARAGGGEREAFLRAPGDAHGDGELREVEVAPAAAAGLLPEVREGLEAEAGDPPLRERRTHDVAGAHGVAFPGADRVVGVRGEEAFLVFGDEGDLLRPEQGPAGGGQGQAALPFWHPSGSKRGRVRRDGRFKAGPRGLPLG